MTLDLGYGPSPRARVLETVRGRDRAVETWSLTGRDGDEVLAEVSIPPHPRRIAVLAHGADNSRHARYIRVAARAWAGDGTVVAAIDAPHHGDRADGTDTEAVGANQVLLERWVGDHRGFLDALEERFPRLPIGLVGFSMGGLFAVPLTAIDRRVRVLIVVIAGSTRVSYPTRYPDRDLAVLELTDPAVHAPEVSVPVLLLATEDDEIVPVEAVDVLRAAFPDAELVIGPGTHVRWKDAAAWYRRMAGFLVENL